MPRLRVPKPLDKVTTTVHILTDLMKDFALSKHKQKEIHRILLEQIDDTAVLQALLRHLIKKLIVNIPEEKRSAYRRRTEQLIREIVKAAAAGAAEGAVRGAKGAS